MDKNGLAELRRLVEQVMYAPTKKGAQQSIRRLEFMAATVKVEIDGYDSGKLSEVIGYAKEAAGRVRNKEHWIARGEQCWYVFENAVRRELES